ncbi:nucleotidyltransferase family protein [Salisediminibacterium halotolerans]|uniref:Molybdenum cofactor cytidylyltransferase n=1 Tax=Salisediminibacterium halotolerans TaxID=517425 RepID=A0A1H9T8I0_9BACI|nr:nucleotidyltransferase family protein [Salisediminibacterium haloalkalitolerans]SER92923.1 molybdenum cofactor cytidylyltransferase [Salisediminibacterium haloalkalitolerans]
MERNVDAVVLAAGTSSRMGALKPLLSLDQTPMLQHVIEQLLSMPFRKIIVVLGYEKDVIRDEVSVASDRVVWVENSRYDLGQSTSFLAGFHHIRHETAGAMFFLGDQPLIQRETVEAIERHGRLLKRKERDMFAVRPEYDSIPGHPVYWGHCRPISPETFEKAGDRGGIALMRTMNVHHVPVDDPFTVFDVDTPEDYAALQRLWYGSGEPENDIG